MMSLKGVTMSGKFYAVANFGSPVSVRIYADSAAMAAAWFLWQETNFADSGRMDAEEDLDIDGESMDSGAFDEALQAKGWQVLRLDICGDGQWSIYGRA
jgi:hypothetical protein